MIKCQTVQITSVQLGLSSAVVCVAGSRNKTSWSGKQSGNYSTVTRIIYVLNCHHKDHMLPFMPEFKLRALESR